MTITLNRRTFTGTLALTLAAALDRGIASTATAFAHQTASPAASPTPIAHPTGAGELVLRIDIGGGFVPVDFLMTHMPGFSLYGDGRLIFLGPQIAIYPPPALPNLRTVRLTDEGMQQVLGEAQQAGLFEGNRTYRESQVSDAATTTFTLNAADKSIVVSAYGLGIGNDPDWSDEERTARAKLFAFAQRMATIQNTLPASMIAEPEAAYQIDRLQIISYPAAPESSAATPTVEATTGRATPIPQPPMDWPLSTPLATSGDAYPAPGHVDDGLCVEITGDEAATLVDALRSANSRTPWRSDGELYQVFPRPLLPDEMACRPRTPFPLASPAATPVP